MKFILCILSFEPFTNAAKIRQLRIDLLETPSAKISYDMNRDNYNQPLGLAELSGQRFSDNSKQSLA